MKTKNIFKVGDKVYDFRFGWGVVEIDDTHGEYPLLVEFESLEAGCSYSVDGRPYSLRKRATLSFTEYDLVNGGFSQVRPNPMIAVDTPIFVRNLLTNGCYDGEWYLRYFSHFNTDGQAVSFEEQLKSTEAKDTSTWYEYSLENPLL